MARDAEPRTPGPLATEARELVASARALLEELVEEGVDQLDRAAPEPAASGHPPPRPPREAPRIRPAPSEGGQLGLMGDDAPWGEEPTLEEVREALGE